MMTKISKRFDFDAAHFLPNVPEGHKCGHMHGHTYVVEVFLEGQPREPEGWFLDYAEIADAWEPLGNTLDHKLLNDIEGLSNPTTENLAPWILRRLIDSKVGVFVVGVRVYESSTTWCEVMR
jgi:6-pyruvoyltetrahydropterin/6-carboxytetrahydropterin synthase